jgi:DNA-binding LacI/PurR family transcriptional regulator
MVLEKVNGCTQTDIARAVGVSQSAVAFVLGAGRTADPRHVNSRLRRRILDTARRMNYRPHRQAQLLRGVRSGIIGALGFAGPTQFAAQRAEAIARAVQAAGYQLLSSNVEWYRDGMSTACAAMLDARVEGVILVSPSAVLAEEHWQCFQRHGISVVALSGVELPGVPQVRADIRQGMHDLTRHLLGLDHRHLAFLTHWADRTRRPAYSWPVIERIDGFREAIMAAQGKMRNCWLGARGRRGKRDREGVTRRIMGEVISSDLPFSFENPYRSGEEAMALLLEQGLLPDAVLCTNDDWALGALTACSTRGVQVPEDVAVTGFDGALFSAHGTTPLTTMVQPLEEMAQKAVQMLTVKIQGKSLPSGEELVRMPCRLAVRRSCGTKEKSPATNTDKADRPLPRPAPSAPPRAGRAFISSSCWSSSPSSPSWRPC